MIKFLRQLRDLDWQCDLAFLADFTEKQSILNLKARIKQ